MKRTTWARIAAASLGACLLVGVATTASAETEEDVDINVEITPVDVPGVLALSVDPGNVELVEDGSTELVRQFTGTLPLVTVTDTRTAEEIPGGAAWYVVGSATSFHGTGGQPDISAAHLGWEPYLVQASEEGLVDEGDTVDTILDGGANAVGLVGQEFLAISADSAAIAQEGAWSARADLFLRTPADVAPGSYASTLTLSLFE